jgi:AcrR family transcriptional regulator
VYIACVPKLWSETIEAHRREVHDAILDTSAELISEHGLLAVTMSQIAEETGIGRATLYKYFPDVESILLAWHERQISDHLAHLTEVRDRGTSAYERLERVLQSYALLSRHQHPDEAAMRLLHRDPRIGRAHHQLHEMVRDLVVAAAEAGVVRSDVPPDELASYCIGALTATRAHGSEEAVRRLVQVTLAGMRP